MVFAPGSDVVGMKVGNKLVVDHLSLRSTFKEDIVQSVGVEKSTFFKRSFRVSSIAYSKESPLAVRKRYNMLGVHLSLKKL